MRKNVKFIILIFISLIFLYKGLFYDYIRNNDELNVEDVIIGEWDVRWIHSDTKFIFKEDGTYIYDGPTSSQGVFKVSRNTIFLKNEALIDAQLSIEVEALEENRILGTYIIGYRGKEYTMKFKRIK